MNFTKGKRLTRGHEDTIPHAYQDSLGYWTIGVGHLIDKRKGGKLPPEIVEALYDYDYNEKFYALSRRLPWFTRLSEVRQAVLVDMAFNLGVQGLMGFTKTLTHLEAGEYQLAAKEMLKSEWRSQVGNRARRLAAMMSTNRWPD